MNDAQLLDYLKNITDPVDALNAIVENADFFGYDPYYGDIHNALIAMADRVAKQQEQLREKGEIK